MKALLEQWRQQFTFIVIDGPPAFYADALYLASMSDTVLLAAHANETSRDATLHAFHTLGRSLPNHTTLGLILENALDGGLYAHA
jgi:Mrp family chromosome partitioning ATPase